jgi:protein SCO1
LRTFVTIALLALSVGANAQTTGKLPAVFDGVGIDEKLGETLPLDLIFRDEAGQSVVLADYFDGSRPVLLNLVYHECPMLCSLTLTEFTGTLQELYTEDGWIPGDQFDVLTVSFSATEMPELAARAKARYLGQLGAEEAAAGWHYLTGTEESIRALADAVGFRFKWMSDTSEFAHPAALMFMSGSGKITRYLHGMAYKPADVRRAVVEASEGKVGTTVDRIFLYCYRYDSEANSYVLRAQNLMRGGGLLTVIVLVLGLATYWRRERRALSPHPG